MLAVGLILSMMTALSLPVLTVAREKAIDCECMSRLRQVGVGFVQYRSEYRYFPRFAPPYGLGDRQNWADLWSVADPGGTAFSNDDFDGNGVADGNQTEAPRVPRLLAAYAGTVEVLHCPCQGASGYWPDVGPFHYNATYPWDGTNSLWMAVAEAPGKPRVERERREPLAGCQSPAEASLGGASWRHGDRQPAAKAGVNHHLFVNQSVKPFTNPMLWTRP